MPPDPIGSARRGVWMISELAHRPVRRENYILAWQRLTQYVARNYQYQGTVGTHAIWRRGQPGVVTAGLQEPR